MTKLSPKEANKQILLQTPGIGCEELIALHTFELIALEQGKESLAKDIREVFESVKHVMVKKVHKEKGDGNREKTS